MAMVRCALCALLAFAWSARAGQVSSEGASLDEVARESEVAVVVELERPAGVAVEVPVDAPPGKQCGTYRYVAYRARVVEVLYPGERPPLTKGQRIHVLPADTPTLVELTRLACLEGGSKSPVFRRFRGGAAPNDGKRRIALLRWQDGYGWLEAVSGSWLAPSKRAAVRKARAGGPPGLNRQWQLGEDGLCVVDEDCQVAPAGSRCDGEARPLGAVSLAYSQRLRAWCEGRKASSPMPHGAPPAASQRAVCRSMRCAMAATGP